jgi:CheY-like chemotaxis protein
MPIKILLADKSITIQKVVEMLFSGKEYQVVCVSDGETALNEASRVIPDVILADIDLPRVDGYSFAARLKQKPSLAQTPVILMMSRDDVFDNAKAKQVSIVDHIAKPFESQELISKVKKAVSTTPPRPAEPAAAPPKPAAFAPQTRFAPPTAPPAAARPKQAPPKDIFDIIQEAPSQAEVKGAAPKQEEEGIYEVEPVVEVEQPAARDLANALPVGEKAVKEMRENLGLSGKSGFDDEITSFESLDMAVKTAKEYMPPKKCEPARQSEQPVMQREAREYVPPRDAEASAFTGAAGDAKLRSIAEEIVSRIARDHFSNMPASRPGISAETMRGTAEESASQIVREIAREVVEKVAWEVVPDLAAMLIREEIDRLKAEP